MGSRGIDVCQRCFLAHSVPAAWGEPARYGPLWDVHLVDWTQAATNAGLRHLLTSHEDVETLFQSGAIVSDTPDGPENQDPEIRGLHASGVVINCPPMFVAR